MSLPEVLLWEQLRKRPGGYRFRRQHPLGRFTLDFYCAKAKLAIEVDGLAHVMGDRPERDEKRDGLVGREGIRTVRVAASDVLNDLDAVVRMILEACSA